MYNRTNYTQYNTIQTAAKEKETKDTYINVLFERQMNKFINVIITIRILSNCQLNNS